MTSSRFAALGMTLLLAGSLANLVVAARRPFRERSTLASSYYAAAARAADALARDVPEREPVGLLVYDDDVKEGVDMGAWAPAYLQWLAFPRTFPVYRMDAVGRVSLAP